MVRSQKPDKSGDGDGDGGFSRGGEGRGASILGKGGQKTIVARVRFLRPEVTSGFSALLVFVLWFLPSKKLLKFEFYLGNNGRRQTVRLPNLVFLHKPSGMVCRQGLILSK